MLVTSSLFCLLVHSETMNKNLLVSDVQAAGLSTTELYNAVSESSRSRL